MIGIRLGESLQANHKDDLCKIGPLMGSSLLEHT